MLWLSTCGGVQGCCSSGVVCTLYAAEPVNKALSGSLSEPDPCVFPVQQNPIFEPKASQEVICFRDYKPSTGMEYLTLGILLSY